MSLDLFFVGLALLLAAGAALLLLVVIVRREGQLPYLALAILLIALAVGVWLTAIRNPLRTP